MFIRNLRLEFTTDFPSKKYVYKPLALNNVLSLNTL